MNTEITTTENTTALATITPRDTPASVVQIGEWAAELDAAHRLSGAMLQAGYLPDSLIKGKNQEQAVAAGAITILAGKSVGFDPLAAVQNIFPVYGKPALYARAMIGLVQGHGHEAERVEVTETYAVWRGRRRGRKEWQTFEFTMERAKKAGFTTNKQYQTNPLAMLEAKAQSDLVRAMFADLLMGMPYSAEDLQLEDLGEVEDAPKATVKRQRKSAAKSTPKTTGKGKEGEAPAQEAEPEQEPQGDQQEDNQTPEPEPISQQTWDEIKDLLKEKAPGESPGPWAMRTIGRTVKKWAEFTQAEGDQMLELLISGELGAQAEAA